MMQAAPKQVSPVPRLTIEDTDLKLVSQFTYLGNVLQDDVNLDSDKANCIYKASKAFGVLSIRVWRVGRIHLHTKIQVYQVVVLTPLLYV